MGLTPDTPFTKPDYELSSYNQMLVRLHLVNEKLADQIETIRKAMEGKGVSPVDAPLVNFKLKKIEDCIRKIGGDPKNPVPFEASEL